MKLCCIKGCDSGVLANSFCVVHYERVRHYGDPMFTKTSFSSIESRFMAGWREYDGCWEWTRSETPSGYGRLCVFGRQTTARRVAYVLLKGALNDNQELRNTCDNRACVNPAQLVISDTAKKGGLRPFTDAKLAGLGRRRGDGYLWDLCNERLAKQGVAA